MDEKAKMLKKFYGIEKSKYFNSKDRQAILSWSDRTSKSIYKKLVDQIEGSNYEYLKFSTCPFCFRHASVLITQRDSKKVFGSIEVNCAKCAYSKNHKVTCDNTSSDFRVIDSMIEDSTLPFYKLPFSEILIKIEKRCKKDE